MALLAPQTPAVTGMTPTYSAVSASDTIKYSGDNIFLIVKNAGVASITATVVVPGTSFGQANPDVTVTVAAAGESWIGPFDEDMQDSATDLITVTFSVTTSVTAAVVKL